MANTKRKSHCGKVGFKTLLAAQVVAKKTVSRSKKRGEPILIPLQAYKCQHCPDYHVGRVRERGIDWKLFESEEKKLRERTSKERQRNDPDL